MPRMGPRERYRETQDTNHTVPLKDLGFHVLPEEQVCRTRGARSTAASSGAPGMMAVVRTRIWSRLAQVLVIGCHVLDGIHPVEGRHDSSTSPELSSFHQKRSMIGDEDSAFPGATSKATNNLEMREGYVFQVDHCPQSITEEEAEKRATDSSLPGNMVELRTFIQSGRTGNHFMMLSGYLSLAYCCKSKLFTLPATSGHGFTGENKLDGSPARWFDFSEAVAPHPDFESLADRLDVCPSHVVYEGASAFMFEGIHKDLMRCINRVFLRGCEAAYMGSLFQDNCARKLASEAPAARKTLIENQQFQDGSHTSQRWDEAHGMTEAEQRSSNPSLVMHIRSGDIFGPNNHVIRHHGQPPLEFYLAVLGHQEWSSVLIVTSSPREDLISPVFTILDNMVKMGALGSSVRTALNRPLLLDMHDFLCCDALAISTSSLHFVSLGHSKASAFFLPTKCGYPFKQGRYLPNLTDQLSTERPQAEVYSWGWNGSTQPYTVYDNWTNSPNQRLEMLLFKGGIGLEKC